MSSSFSNKENNELLIKSCDKIGLETQIGDSSENGRQLEMFGDRRTANYERKKDLNNSEICAIPQ